MYKHLSQNERYQIALALKVHQSISQIAEHLNRHKSTISREIQRGGGARSYNPAHACKVAWLRSQASRNAWRIDAARWADVVFYLGLQWSPEQIAAKLGISHEAIYLGIYRDKQHGGALWRHLRCQRPRRKRWLQARDRRGHIPHRRPIHERAAHVQQRLQVGHWEGDTVVGPHHQGAIVTLVERKSGYAKLVKVPHKSAQAVRLAIEQALTPLRCRVKTLTVDNGTEFAQHRQLDQTLGIQTYFADPYCSWQRGSNENFNGLLRQYIPKKRAMSTVSEEELAMIEMRLNHRPRKRLGFKTPHEVFHASFKRVALRT